MMKNFSLLFVCAMAFLEVVSSFAPPTMIPPTTHTATVLPLRSNTDSTEEWKARSLNQEQATAASTSTLNQPTPNLQAGALAMQQPQAVQQAPQAAQQSQAAQQTPLNERVVMGLPCDEWWDRPLDRERDPVLPHKEWQTFWKEGTPPKRQRHSSKFPYDEEYSCL